MGRMPCCAKEGLNRGAWSAREDRILTNYINIHGEGKWRDLPQKAGLWRCGKSCRLRWLNYLRPDIKRGNISKEEEELIIKLHRLLGNRWSLIAGRLPGRTDNEIKNYWNTNLNRKLLGKKIEKQPRKIKDMNPAGGSLVDVAELKVDTTHVIRTKAVRCTKVFLPQEEGNWINKKSVELSLRGDSPLSSAQQADDSSNFLMDFDIGELLVSDVLNSDFLQVCGDGIQEANNSPGGDNGNKSSLCSDYPFSAHKMVAENGMECDPLQPNAALELKRLSSFLDSEDEWMEQQ